MFRRLVLFSLIWSSWSSFSAEWLEIQSGTHPVTIETTGIVASKNSTRFNPPPSFHWNMNIGAIVQEGKRVVPGELLVRFEGTREDQRITQAKQQLQVRQGELVSLIERHTQQVESEKLNLAEAKSEAEKAHRKAAQPAELVPNVEYQKLVKQRELADKRVEQQTRRAEISELLRTSQKRRLEMAVQRLSRMVDSAQADIDRLTIRAPSSGIAIIGTAFNGEKFDVGVSAQPNHVVVELVDDTELEVHGVVREGQAAQIEVGQLVRMTAEAAGGLEFTGSIVFIANSVRRKSRFVEEMVRDFRVALDRRPEGLTLGVSVQAMIEINRAEHSIALPHDAILYRNGVPGAITRDGWQRIRLGSRSNGKVIVTNGLTEGDEVQI
ncbi:MAG: efflux RND transporter periplasmic adaptor subunit [Gammaproteobacteria bacterium]|nr:efflux RND transporter periplasmic adaptor subunit [Gammaproteobacteria bacterium]